MKSRYPKILGVTLASGLSFLGELSWAGEHDGHILAEKSAKVSAEFDLVHTKVVRKGPNLNFQTETRNRIGKKSPTATGKLGGAEVYSYVWPTSLNSSAVGFDADQGILALAVTVHPDFDDTPKYDENSDGTFDNDGAKWHSHWVVLVNDDSCGKGALKVKDIPANTKPQLPATWPGLPILLDSPGYTPNFDKTELEVEVPLKDLGFPENFNYDGVTAALTVNANVHNPLLCVSKVFDVASGDLSLPGQYK